MSSQKVVVGITFASVAGLTFPRARKAPPRTTMLFTLLANDESRLIAGEGQMCDVPQ